MEESETDLTRQLNSIDGFCGQNFSFTFWIKFKIRLVRFKGIGGSMNAFQIDSLLKQRLLSKRGFGTTGQHILINIVSRMIFTANFVEAANDQVGLASPGSFGAIAIVLKLRGEKVLNSADNSIHDQSNEYEFVPHNNEG